MNAKDIVSKEFDTVKRGGYDAAEVDTFLRMFLSNTRRCRMRTKSLRRSLKFWQRR